MKIAIETNKKRSVLLGGLPTGEQYGKEAIGEHNMEQSTSSSVKLRKTQSRRKSKPYKVEIHSSVSKGYSVNDEEDNIGTEIPTTSRDRKIKRKTPPRQETVDIAPKKYCTESSSSPSGVGIFTFEMPTEFHSNLHQLAMSSQQVLQSPTSEKVHQSVIKAMEDEQKSQQECSKSALCNRENRSSLVLSIPRSPLFSISDQQLTTTPTPSSVQQSSILVATTAAAASPSPVIISNHKGKAKSPLETAVITSTSSVTQPVPESAKSGESDFAYPASCDNNTVVVSQLKSTSTPTIARVDSIGSDATFNSCVAPVTSTETTTKMSEPTHVVTSCKPTETTLKSSYPVTTPVAVTHNGNIFESPPPAFVVTKPTSIQVGCSYY